MHDLSVILTFPGGLAGALVLGFIAQRLAEVSDDKLSDAGKAPEQQETIRQLLYAMSNTDD